MIKNKFYITTPIYYANGDPHLGSVYTTIVADVLARWNKLNGNKVFFLTGTDEHGQKIQETAEKQGKKPRDFVDEVSKKFIDAFKLLNINNDNFIRTTDKNHEGEVKKILQELYEKKFIYKGYYESYYCVGCEQYLTPSDLIDGVCPLHKRKPELRKEEAYLFKLSFFQDKIVKLIESGEYKILPEKSRKEVINFIKSGLKDISISRLKEKVYWGIELPFDKNHTCFVWVDAFWNYLTGLKTKKQFDKFWPPDVQLMARDIIRVHSTIWPALLLATENELPKTLFVHGYFTVNGQKMSKSLGNVIDPVYLINNYGVDALRYSLLRDIPAGADGDFSEKTLIDRANADLADALGNLLQRTSILIEKNFDLEIPKQGKLEEIDKNFIKKTEIFEQVNKLMQDYEWHKALEKIFELVHEANKYINQAEPWKVQDKSRLGTILYNIVESLRIVSILLYPFIPETAEKLSQQIGQEITSFKKTKFSKTTKGKIKTPEILFKKLLLKQEDIFERLNLKVAKVLEVKDHPNADKLYVLTIDLGEKRQLVAGIKPYYSKEQMLGKHIVVISNLQHAEIRGQKSQGMLLAAELNGIVRALEAPESKPGDQVFIEGLKIGKGIIALDDFKKIILTTKDKKIIYNDKFLKTLKEEIKVDIGDNATIR